MRKILALLSVLLVMTSCVDKSLYQYDPENPTKPGQTNDRTFYENVDFAAAFATHHTLTVKKTTTSIMSIYYAYPYKNGADGEQILRDADAVFYSAGEYTLEVPNHVKSIYYWNGRSFTQKSIDGLTSVTLPDGSRSVAELDKNPEVINRINSFFPEKAMARNKEEIQKCCDLEIKPREGETLESVTLTLTYIGDGCGGVAGNLFIYTYPASKRDDGTLTLSDVTFYGLTGGPLKVTEDDSRTSYTLTAFTVSDKTKLDRNKSIFRQENNVKANWGDGNSQKIIKRDVQITHENFKEGINLGFCFLGNSSVAGFSTPELNDPIEKDIKLSAAGGFVDFNVGDLQSRCLVYHTIVDDGTEFNILGCENRNVQDPSYDGDYNDMLVMVSSDPSYIKPVDALENPVEDNISVTKGFWLFEDIYPEVENNDFDYNDVVVQYTIIKNETKKTFKVLSQLVAKGCSQGNVFGLDCGTTEQVVFSNISGYKNVYAEESGNVSAPLEIKEVEFSFSSGSEIEPWLKPNGKDKLKLGTYCEGMKYPYVLDIQDSNFPGWAIERTHIIEAYRSFPTGTWYRNPNAGNYIKR